ncbi:MAG: beta-lactamase family protein [Pseudomonadales bacterium]|nr:beta-lactamase family protein [Pseudomonadales bacterium]
MLGFKNQWAMLLTSFFLVGCDQIQRINELPVAKAHTAKQLCSYIFNSGFDLNRAKWRFIAPDVSVFPLIWKTEVDYDNKRVTVSDFVFLNESLEKHAVYREGIGCTSVVNKTPDQLQSETLELLSPPLLSHEHYWPQGSMGINEAIIDGLDYERVEQALTLGFSENREKPKNTTAMLVAYQGSLIAERYGLSVGVDTPLVGWSMTKSLTSTLVGLLSDQDILDVNDPAPIADWQHTEKEDITIDDLLRMSSGLDYVEGNTGLSDSTQMLYLESDQIDYMTGLDLVNEPGTTHNYSTGEANLLASIIQDTVGGSAQDAYNFYQQALFFKLGIGSAFIEFDESGQFVGGAHGYMTARDWLRMGQFYLQRGQWNGEQLLSEQWIDYATTPSANNNTYGAQFWLNTDGEYFPGYEIPHDTFLFAGHHGQMVVIVPSKELVLLRTGVFSALDKSIVAEVLEEVIRALPN